MAKDSSFDIVSEVEIQEVDNAFQQTKKELASRYDLKGSGASIDLDKQRMCMTVNAPSDFVAKQVIDVLNSKLVKRGVDLKAMQWGAVQAASGGTVRQVAAIANGIGKDKASEISKDLKAQKFKAKISIEGDKLRVVSPSKDTLQEIIAYTKSKDFGIPLQFINYR